MKRYLLLLFVLGLVSVTTLGQGSVAPGRVRLLVTTSAPPFSATNTLIVAAEGVNGVAGAGTDIITNDVTSFCDIHFNKVTVTLPNEESPGTATLVGQVVAASDPANFGAFVKITAKTDGTATFVFETLNGVGSTGPAGVSMTGTVQITLLPPPA